MPLLCPACNQSSHRGNLCSICSAYLSPLAAPCPHCSKPDCNFELCGLCQSKPPHWDNAYIAWHFEGLARYLIHQFKYQHDFSAAYALSEKWVEYLSSLPKPDAIIASPMHHRKFQKRSFNQADWLADKVSQALNIPVWNGIEKNQVTMPLEGLNKKARAQELKGVYRTKANIKRHEIPKTVAIIDDVFTTGATVGEIARVLKQVGVEQVDVWVLARTPLKAL